MVDCWKKPCLIQFHPNPRKTCFLAWTVAVSFSFRTFSRILSSGLHTALRDLAHNLVAFVLISIFAFCCRVSHTTTVSGDEKCLASKLIWKGKSWPKVAGGGNAMIFLCFWGKSSLVFWLLLRFTWSYLCRSGIIYKIFLRCINWPSIKAFQGHLNWWRHKWNKMPAHSRGHTGATGISGLLYISNAIKM